MSSNVSMETLIGAPNVTTITRFALPLTHVIFNIDTIGDYDTRNGERWRPLIDLVMQDEDHRYTRMFRIHEKPQDVLIITGTYGPHGRSGELTRLTSPSDWNSRSALDRFRNSPRGLQYRRFLEAKAVSPVVEQDFAFEYRSFRGSDPGRGLVELCHVFFLRGLLADEAKLRALLNVRGLRLDYGLGSSRNSPLYDLRPLIRPPNKGFALDEVERDGVRVCEVVFVNSWRDGEAEIGFKRSEYLHRRPGPIRLVLEDWEEQMRDLGAVAWSSEHCNPLRVAGYLCSYRI